MFSTQVFTIKLSNIETNLYDFIDTFVFNLVLPQVVSPSKVLTKLKKHKQNGGTSLKDNVNCLCVFITRYRR